MSVLIIIKHKRKKQTENVMSISRQKSKNQAKTFKPKESETSPTITSFLHEIRVAQYLRQETSHIIIILITKGGNVAHSGQRFGSRTKSERLKLISIAICMKYYVSAGLKLKFSSQQVA